MPEKALVLSADSWSMKDEQTAEIREGWSVWYVNDYREDNAQGFGFRPSKISIIDKLAEDLRKVKLPAMCELDFGSRPGAGGKATLTISGFKVLGSVEFDKLGVSLPKAA